MAKKYKPSGYQIIDLGDIDLSDLPVTKTADESEDIKILCDLDKSGRLADKPILITYLATNNNSKRTEFAYISGSGLVLHSIVLDVQSETNEVVIDEP